MGNKPSTQPLQRTPSQSSPVEAVSCVTPHENVAYYTKSKEELEERTRREGESVSLTMELERVITKLRYYQEEVRKSEIHEFDNAMKVGSVSVNITNAIIEGEAGVGKTSTKFILFDEPPPGVRSSTALAEPPVQIQVDSSTDQTPKTFSGVKVQATGSIWRPVNDCDLERIVIDTISSIAEEHLSSGVSGKGSGEVSRTANGVGNTMTPGSTSELEMAIANIHGEMADLVAKNKITPSDPETNRDPREIFGSNWIYFIDSGGQPHFHNLLPHFVHGISVALFVHRLSQTLEDHPMVEYYEEGQSISKPYRSPLTTEDTLKCLARSMQSHAIGEEKPKLVIIGTFLDKIQDSSETLEGKNTKLLQLLMPAFTDQLVFCGEEMQQLIFSLNAKNPGAHEKRIAEQIRAVVEKAPSRKIEIPIWWYVLELTLKKLSNRLNRQVLSKQECLEVARQLGISENALDGALKFFHKQHIFHYYPDVLPNVIFTSPQVLLDKLTELVKRVYVMRDVTSNPSAAGSGPMSGKWQKFRDQGIVTLEFLESFRQHYVEGLFTPPDLIKIFVKLLILTPFSAEESHQSIDFRSHKTQYYLPSLLDVLSPTEIEDQRIFSSPAEPLLIRFPNGWPRAGVFCCLQVYLIHNLGWKLALKRGNPKLIAQNCVMLSPPDTTCIVTLIDSFSYLEVHVKADNPNVLRRAYRVIQRNILKGIDASCKTLRYDKEEPNLAFFCPCGIPSSQPTSTRPSLPQHHIAELIKQEASLKCTIDEAISFKVNEKHSIWLSQPAKAEESSVQTKSIVAKVDTSEELTAQAKVSTQTIGHGDIPSTATVEGLLCESGLTSGNIDRECSDEHILMIYSDLENWERVAFHLGLKQADIQAIKYDAHHDPKLMRLYMLKKWKSHGIIKGNGTYRVLIKALLECGCTEQAQHVCRLLKSTPGR